jgi:hypothetical protein
MRSAVEPDSISRPATTNVYASIVHWSPDTDAWSERWMEGSATLTIVASSPTISSAKQQIARISSRCARLGASVSAAAEIHLMLGDSS